MPKTPEKSKKYTSIIVMRDGQPTPVGITTGDTVEIDYLDGLTNQVETATGIVYDVGGFATEYAIELDGERIFASPVIRDVRVVKPKAKKKRKK